MSDREVIHSPSESATTRLQQRLENAGRFVLHSVVVMAFHLKEWNLHDTLSYKP